MAEKYSYASPYNYVLNNPISSIDPDGRVVLPIVPVVAGAVARIVVQNAPRIYQAYRAYQATKVMVSTVKTITAGQTINTAEYTYSELTVTPTDVTAPPGGFTTHEGVYEGSEAIEAVSEDGTVPAIGGVPWVDESITTPETVEVENAPIMFDDRTLADPLRKDKNGLKIPDPEAVGKAHTQLGTKQGRKGKYKQAREFDEDGREIRDIDFTDHGRPNAHPHNPHQHVYKGKGKGNRERDKSPDPVEGYNYKQ